MEHQKQEEQDVKEEPEEEDPAMLEMEIWKSN
jgi:hypothetical protein